MDVSNAVKQHDDFHIPNIWPKDQNYLRVLQKTTLDSLRVKGSCLQELSVPLSDDYNTCNPATWVEFRQAQQILQEYFDDQNTDSRPLNCLLLGPPGSGKTTLAKKIGKTLNNAVFLEYNLSQFDHPGRVAEMFRDIGLTRQRVRAPKIVFLDEFDVTTGGSSMIRYLIHSMYEGIFGDGQKLEKTVFIFSGSYLKNKTLLTQLQRAASDFDFIHFLYDNYVHLTQHPRQQRTMRDLLDLSLKYREVRNQLSSDRDALEYLKRLDKLVDFLSRINGFVMEILDLSAPLETTADPLQVGVGDYEELSNRLFIHLRQPEGAREILNYILAKEKYAQRKLMQVYRDGLHDFDPCVLATDPILSFKNMLLCERLMRVVLQLEDRFASRDCAFIRISRRLLNYLCVVPLIHGMRSLQYIVRQLALEPQDRVTLPMEAPTEIMRMHVRSEGIYRDDLILWNALASKNPVGFADLKDEDVITIRFKPNTTVKRPPVRSPDRITPTLALAGGDGT